MQQMLHPQEFREWRSEALSDSQAVTRGHSRQDAVGEVLAEHHLMSCVLASLTDEASKLAQELAPADAGEFGLEVVEGNADNSEHARHICSEAIQVRRFDF